MRDYWNIVQMSYLGEREPSSEVVKSLKKIGGKGTKVFVPAIKGPGKSFKDEKFLVEGYVFVKPSKDPMCLFSVEEDPLFLRAVSQLHGKERILNQISDRELENIRSRLEELKDPEKVQVGDSVQVTDGVFRNMVGKVQSIDEEGIARVDIQLHSKSKTAKVPLFCLTKDYSDPSL